MWSPCILGESYLITKSSSLLNFVNMESINWCENPWIFYLVYYWGSLCCLVWRSMLWILTVFQSFSFHQSSLSSWQVKIDKIGLFLPCKYIIPSDKYVKSWIGLKIHLFLHHSFRQVCWILYRSQNRPAPICKYIIANDAYFVRNLPCISLRHFRISPYTSGTKVDSWSVEVTWTLHVFKPVRSLTFSHWFVQEHILKKQRVVTSWTHFAITLGFSFFYNFWILILLMPLHAKA